MNRADLTEKISKDTGVTKTTADQIIDSMIGNIRDALKKREKVMIKDFGTLTVSKRSARKGRNPQNGSLIEIEERAFVRFKTGKRMDSALNRTRYDSILDEEPEKGS